MLCCLATSSSSAGRKVGAFDVSVNTAKVSGNSVLTVPASSHLYTLSISKGDGVPQSSAALTNGQWGQVLRG